ncbi:MAG: hypothetical protein IPN63_06795 [Gammaproteobacteria bacterium]|nr:hypothetical protein [Gammaproteobacteria bacterium]
MTADDPYRTRADAGEDVGIATVYRVLTPVREAVGLGGRSMRPMMAPRAMQITRGDHHDRYCVWSAARVTEFSQRRRRTHPSARLYDAGYELITVWCCMSGPPARKTGCRWME